ncbi:MAG: hypothetical protein LUF02_06875, partial [Erysipelotrichaceae bacterium]|nr:hypothetical protein [Erysipelotrichaceae bacterium]
MTILTNKQTNKQTKNICCFIIPYFGKLPNTMPVFLKTVKMNEDYNWIIFTDDQTVYDYPDNLKLIYISFNDFKNKISKCFDFEIQLSNPKKLCDFKPAYGYIFKDYLTEFSFWGYCDLDQYFGDLSKFIPLDYLEKYDKIFSLGHMTIYRNTEYINTIFLKEYSNDNIDFSFKEVASNINNVIFDEWPYDKANINLMSEHANLRIDYSYPMFDVGPHRSYFLGSTFDAINRSWGITGNKNNLILWDNGKIYACYMCEKILHKEEVIYVHVQKRKLNILNFSSDVNTFLIYPNKIEFVNNYSDDLIMKKLDRVRIKSFFRSDENKYRMECL